MTASAHALVFGATGQIGAGLLSRLLAQGVEVDAVTRGAVPASGGAAMRWLQHDLFGDRPAPSAPDLVFSLGPLDGFVRWLERTPSPPRRVVAFGSTSAVTKRDSVDPAERELASHLQRLEARLAVLCHERGSAWTLLRPTLIYGVGRDRNLTRVAQLARRWRAFVLPANATGLRQPVHADDLSAAAVQAAFAGTSVDRAYDLSGGETLRYNEMVRRTLRCLTPPPRLFEVPSPLFRVAFALASASGRLRDAGKGTFARMREDLVFDHAAAQRDFGYAPRPFAPSADMFQSSHPSQ